MYLCTRSQQARWATTSSLRPFGHLNFVLRTLRPLRPCDPRTDASDHIFVLGIFILLLLLVVCSHCWGRKASMLGPQGLTRATRPNYLQHFFERKCWFWDKFFGHSRGNSWHFLVIYSCPWYILGMQCIGEVQTWIFPAIKESESC